MRQRTVHQPDDEIYSTLHFHLCVALPLSALITVEVGIRILRHPLHWQLYSEQCASSAMVCFVWKLCWWQSGFG